MRSLILRLALAVVALSPALALGEGSPTIKDAPAIIAGDDGRFTLQPADGGFLRMNRETGAVSFCTVKEGVAACRLGADERAAMEAEMERLRAENARLKFASAPRPTLPNDQEFEKALSFTERFLRRIMRLFKEEAPSGGTL